MATNKKTRKKYVPQWCKTSPVSKVVRSTEAQDHFQSMLTTVRLKLFSFPDGIDATDTLSALMVLIGAPCESGAASLGREVPWVRQLHGALRSVATMCLNGYRWDASQAMAMDRALEIASTRQLDIDPMKFTECWASAVHVADHIEKHTFTKEMIA